VQAEEQARRMRFVLERERQEAERKRVEAQGIADFQAIVAKGISAELVKWKAIEVLHERSKTRTRTSSCSATRACSRSSRARSNGASETSRRRPLTRRPYPAHAGAGC
jgi:hypothetical protein